MGRAQFIAMVCAFHVGTSGLVASIRESAANSVSGVLATTQRRIHDRGHARQTSADVGVEPRGNQKENGAMLDCVYSQGVGVPWRRVGAPSLQPRFLPL